MGTVWLAFILTWLGVAAAETPEVQSLLDESEVHFRAGRLPEALALSERALELEETAATLEMTIRYQYELGNLDASAELTQRIADLHGRDPAATLDRAEALVTLVIIQLNRQDHEGAMPPAKLAYSLVCEDETASDPRRAQVASELGPLLADLGEQQQGKRCLELSLAIREAALDPGAVEIATSLGRLAELIGDREPEAARDLYQRALEIAVALDRDSEVVAGLSAGLGVALQDLDEHRGAEKAYRRGLDIFIARENLPEIASTLNSLALLARLRGRRAEAERLFERSLQGFTAVQGPDGWDVALLHNNLGSLLVEKGELLRGRRHLERGLAVLEAYVVNEPELVAANLGDLASLLLELGDVDGAARHQLRAVEIWTKSRGEAHPETVKAKSSLAVTRMGQARLDEAEILLNEALEDSGEELLAGILNDLGDLKMRRQDYAGAKVLFERAVNLDTARWGDGHPEVLASQVNLANALGKLGESEAGLLEQILVRAESFYGADDPGIIGYLTALTDAHAEAGDVEAVRASSERALAIASRTLNELIPELGEREALLFAAERRNILDTYLTWHERPEDTVAAYGALIRWKGGVARALTNRRQALHAGGLPRAARVAMELVAVRRKLAEQTFAPLDPALAEVRSADLARLVERRDSLGRKLAALSRGFRAQEIASEGAVDSLCAAMAKGSTLVDYIRIRGKEARYLAFVLRQETCEVLRYDLGSASDIDRGVSAHREAIGSPQTVPSRVDESGRRLAELVWTPLGVVDEAVIVVGDAAIAGVSFAALPLEEGYLVEAFEVSYLESAAELIHARSTKSDEGALFVGALDYGEPRDVGGPCLDADFAELPGTYAEVAALTEVWDKRSRERHRIIDGDLASEADVRQAMRGQGVVHFATHGLFATDRCQSALVADGIGYNSMALSGIVLSGANDKLGGLDREDGILTAEEVAGLRLSGTSLVVLSASETGLGEAVSGEGVLGLRRAFVASGAHSLVLGLWAAPDGATTELMQDFYKYLLKGKKGPAAALRKAQLARLKANRKAHGEGRPRDWGAYVAS